MTVKKNTTIDDLAGMVQRGFLEMGKRFDQLESRMGGLELRVEGLEREVHELSVRISALETRGDSVEETLEEVVERLGRVERLVNEDHYKRIERLEHNVKNLADQLATIKR